MWSIPPAGRSRGPLLKRIRPGRRSSRGGPKPGDFVDHLRGRILVRTDPQGRFSFQGIPSPDPQRPIMLNARHPDFQASDLFTVQVPADPGAAPILTLEPGCTVSGSVVNRRGNPVPGASVRVFDPSMNFEEQSTHTDRDGRFAFHNVNPGRRRVLVQPRHLAAAWAEVVANPTRPVQNQFVVEPGDSIGGKVVDKAGKPVAGASVGCAVRNSEEGLFARELELNTWTRTAEDGSFRLDPLPRGDLRLIAAAESRRLAGDVVLSGNRADVVIKVEEEAHRRAMKAQVLRPA